MKSIRPSLAHRNRNTTGQQAKIGLIVVLSVVLVTVIVIQLPSPAPATTQRPAARETEAGSPAKIVRRRPKLPFHSPTKVAQPAAVESAPPPSAAMQVVSWPVIPVVPGQATNPFVLPPPLRDELQEGLAAETEQERQLRLKQEPIEALRAERKQQEKERLDELERQRLAKEEQARKEAMERLQRERERLQAVIDQLKQQGVAIVLSDRNGRIAKIGDRTIRVGDQFDGVEVIEIRENGSVIVRPVDSQMAAETVW